MWLIATFPSKKYNIDDYPAVKQHLLRFGYERLKQTGESGARKKTSNQWFETQDSISYWEDFFRPKIVWKRIGSILRFSYDEKGFMSLDSTCFATGEHIKFLVALLNSTMGHYLLNDAPKTGTGDLLVSVQAVEPILVPSLDAKIENELEKLITQVFEFQNFNRSTADIEAKIDDIIFNLYGLENDEINFLKSAFIHSKLFQ